MQEVNDLQDVSRSAVRALRRSCWAACEQCATLCDNCFVPWLDPGRPSENGWKRKKSCNRAKAPSSISPRAPLGQQVLTVCVDRCHSDCYSKDPQHLESTILFPPPGQLFRPTIPKNKQKASTRQCSINKRLRDFFIVGCGLIVSTYVQFA